MSNCQLNCVEGILPFSLYLQYTLNPDTNTQAETPVKRQWKQTQILSLY